MTLKEKLESYAPQPSPEVWESVSRSLRRRRMVRRSAFIGGTALVAAVAALLLVPRTPTTTVETIPSQHEIAQADIPAVETGDALSLPETVQAEKTISSVETEEKTSLPERVESPLPASSQMAALPQGEVPQAPKPATQPAAKAQPATPQSQLPAPQPVEHSQLSTPNSPLTVSQPAAPAKVQPVEEPKTPIIVDPDKVPEMMIPNAFAPDAPEAELHNFQVVLRSGFDISHFKIYIFNRGGRQVFYSTDVHFRWDGTFKGQRQPMGSYVYKLEYRDAEGNLKLVAGTVTLVR